MAKGLVHEGSAFVNFRHHLPDPKDHGFRWVDIKRFGFSAECPDDSGLLAALIGHEQFRDDYAGGGVLPDGLRHGPYWLRSITPDRYDPIREQQAVRILQEWVGPARGRPAGLEAALRQEVFDRLTTADGIHHLGELGAGAMHDWGGVHGEFHEFVLVDRSAGRITLVVAADD
ncbi:hypothetical protein ACFYUY_28355 [Kitasatospora sp. NPDC004745]|uniref:hypothetical protein n=1 Tax=unclassified Kitasatospora TaxID=2633591 RepID=UPI0033C382CC